MCYCTEIVCFLKLGYFSKIVLKIVFLIRLSPRNSLCLRWDVFKKYSSTSKSTIFMPMQGSLLLLRNRLSLRYRLCLGNSICLKLKNSMFIENRSFLKNALFLEYSEFLNWYLSWLFKFHHYTTYQWNLWMTAASRSFLAAGVALQCVGVQSWRSVLHLYFVLSGHMETALSWPESFLVWGGTTCIHTRIKE